MRINCGLSHLYSVPLPGDTTTCPQDAQIHPGNHHCYWVGQEQRSWHDARQACQEVPGADLLVLNNEDVQDFILHYFSTVGTAWIGLIRSSVPGTYHWVDGRGTDSYQNWASPNSLSGDCVQLQLKSEGIWTGSSCKNQQHFICEKHSYSPLQNVNYFLTGLPTFSGTYIVKNATVLSEPSLRGPATVEIMLYPGLWFSHSGLVSSIEFVVQPLQKATRVRFKIFRPYCIPSLYLIPPGCESLQTPFASCDTQPLCNTTGGCMSGHQWCHLREGCLPITSPCSSYAFENITTNILPIASPPRYKGTQPYYSQVADIPMTITSDLKAVQINVMLGDQDVHVYPDDVIGLQHDAGPGCLLHCLPSSTSPWRQSYISLVRQGWAESLLAGFQPTWPSPTWIDGVVCDVRVRYMDHLRPIAPTQSLAAMPRTHPVTLVNRVGPTVTSYCLLDTRMSITGLQIIYPQPHDGKIPVPTGNVTVIVIKINSGSNASSWWGPPIRRSGVRFDARCPPDLPQYTPACRRETGDTWFSWVQFTAGHPGVEVLNITVSNEVSFQNLSVTVQAHDVIQGLRIVPSDPRRMLVDVSQVFSAEITHGTSVTYTWVIDNLAVFAYTGQTYSVIFKRPATYRLELKAVNPVSRQSVATELIADVMHPLTDPQFINVSSMMLVNKPQRFVLRIKADSMAEVTFRWNFGDGSAQVTHSTHPQRSSHLSELDPGTASVKLQDHMTWTYTQPGDYILEVEILAQWSCVRRSLSVSVRSPLSGLSCALTPDNPRINEVVQFEAFPRPSSYGIFYTWNFGDEAPVVVGTSSMVRHRFKARGVYNVTLQANNTANVVSSYVMVMVEEEVAGLRVTTSGRSELGSMTLVRAEVLSGTNIVWAFDMGDGHVLRNLTTGTVSYTYAAEGSYTITVTGSNAVSLVSRSVVVAVYALKVTGITPAGCLASGRKTLFQAQVSGMGNRTQFRWSFGDGGPALVVHGSSRILHAYAAAGNYTIAVTASSPFNTASHQAAICVQAPISSVQLVASNYSVQLNDPVRFVAKVVPREDEQHCYQYQWDLGVPVPLVSSRRELTFTYNQVGVYLATVHVSNRFNSRSSSCWVAIQEGVRDFTISHEGPAQEALSLNKTYGFHLHRASGTNATFHWDFGDGTARTKGRQLSHVYRSCGLFTVTVVGQNLVSRLERRLNVRVVTPITQLSVSAERLVVEIGKVVGFTATMSAGEQVSFFWAVCGDCALHQGSSFFKHNFQEPGTYIVVVTARNEVSEATKMVTIQAEERIQDVQIHSGDLIQGSYFATKEVCRLRAHTTLGSNVSYEWTIRRGPVVVAVDQGSIIAFQPEAAGDYWAVVLAKNALGGVNQRKEIVVLERISGVKVTSTSHKAATGQLVHLNVTVASGTDLLYEWSVEGTEDCLRTNISSLSYVYSSAGTTVVNVTVCNRLGSAKTSLTLRIQQPVSEVSYTVLDMAPPFYVPTNATLRLRGFAARGTDVSWEWSLLGVAGIQFWHGLEVEHTLGSAGVYLLTLNASNEVSWESVHHNVTALDSIQGLAVVPDKANARAGEPVTFTLSVQQGSDVSYFLYFPTLRTGVSLRGDVYEVAFPSVGRHNVTATARNEVSSETRSARVVVLEEVTGLYLVNCCQPAVEANKEMKLTAAVRTGVGVRYRWHLQLLGSSDQHLSGPSITYTPLGTGELTVRVEATGQLGALTLTECIRVQLPVAVAAELWSNGTDLFVEQAVTFRLVLAEGPDVQYQWNFGDSPKTCISQNSTTRHRYRTPGRYMVEAKAFNYISSVVARLTITVHQPACQAPEIQLITPTHDIIRARASYFEANVDLKGCTAYQARYRWEVLESTSCHSSARLPLGSVDTGKPVLALPKLALPLGMHCLQFTVELHRTPLSRKVAVVIRVVQSKLVAIINGGSERTWAIHQDLVLDGSKSYDPDVQLEEEAFLMYHWECEVVDQSTSPCIPPATWAGAVVTILRSTLLPGTTYMFTLTVTKPGKEAARTTQMVLVRAGKTPCVLLECISCHVLWSYGVSRSTHVTLAGRCENCSNKSTHKWTVQSSDGYPLTLDNKTTSTGDSNPNLVIRQGVLRDGVNYTFTLNITDPEKEITGFSSIILTPNYPPSRGVCTIHPDETLYLLETPLSFSCTGWWDVDGGLDQLVYSLMAMTCPNGSSNCDRFQLYRGIKPSFSALLPAGTTDSASAVSVVIEVEDVLGAKTTAVNRTLMVLMPDLPSGSHNVIDWLKRKSQSELWGLIQQGNPGEVIPYSIALISTLNQDSGRHGQDLRDRIAIRNNVTLALTSLNVTTLEDVTKVSVVLAQCAAFPQEFIRGQGLASSLEMSRRMIDIIGNQTRQGSATPTEAGTSILRVLGAAMAAINSGPNNGTEREGDLVTSASIFHLTSKLVQSLMRSRVLNEELLSLSVSEINVQGKRTDPFNLLCAWPGDCYHFHIPRALSHQLSANRELIQVTMSLGVNPFPAGSIGNYSVSTRLGSMELSSPQGVPVPVTGLSAERSIRVTLGDGRTQRLERGATAKTLDPGESLNFTVQPVNSHRAAGLHIRLRFTLLDLGGAKDPNPFVHVHVHNDSRFNGTLYNATRGIMLPSDTGGLSADHTIFLSPEVYDSTSEVLFVTVSSCFSSARVGVSVTVYTSLCQYFDFQSLQWRTDGIVPTHWTRPEEAVCLTRHLTLFGASLFVSPNAVEFLAPADRPVKNLVVAITCALVFAVYIVMALIAHKLDYIDINRVGIIPLCGQHGRHKYEVMVKTGWCRNAGTTAHVGISLYGLNKSGSRHLDKEGAFQRNSLDIFQVETDANLGEIWKIRIWHDNTGLNPSWHLEHVAVWDKQTDNMYYFLAQDWLSVENERNEGMVEKDVLAACPQELRCFSRIFISQLKRGVSEKHIWLSVWDRLPRSHFTRVQRVTCCTLLMYLFLTAAAAWYGAVGVKNKSLPVAYLATITGETVAVGVVLAAIVFPVYLLFTFLFRRTRSQVTVDDPEPPPMEAQTVEMDVYLDPSELGSSSFLSIPGGLDSIVDVSSESCESLGSKKLDSDFQFPPQLISDSLLKSWPSYDSLFDLPDLLNHDRSFSQNKILKRKKALRKQGRKWCSSSDEDPLSFSISDSYDSWSLKHNHLTTSDEDLMRSIAAEAKRNGGLSDQVTLDSGRFSPRAETDLLSHTLRSSSSTWSDLRERKPHLGLLHQSSSFTSSGRTCSSFMTSLEPIPIPGSAFSTRIGISKTPRKWLFPHSTLYLTYILCFLLIAVCISVTVSYGMLFPNHVVLMWLISVFFSFLTSFFVLEPLKVLCDALILALIIKPVDADEDDNLVEEPLVRKTSERISKVRAPYGYSLLQAKEEARKVRALHTLMKNCVVHMLLLLVVLTINYQGCFQNTNARLLQNSIRQSIVGRTLHTPNFTAIRRLADFWQWVEVVLLPHLYNNPRLTLLGVPQLQQVQSKEGHCPLWVERLIPGINPDSIYNHSNSLSTETMTYGIGWSVETSSTNQSWAYSSDGFTGTWAVFVEFTQYSQDVDLYAVVTLLVEFQPEVPVTPTVDIKPFSVLRPSGGVDLLLVSMVLLLLFSFCFLFAEVIALNREGLAYFKEVRRYLQLLIILLCMLIPAFHFSHIKVADRQLSHYKSNRRAFVSFYHVALLAQGVTSLAALLLTILTLKIVGQLRFVRRWCVFGKTFQHIIRELIAASLIFFLLVLVYAQCGYVMFSPALEDFKTFRRTLLSLIAFSRGAASLCHTVRQYPMVAPLYFISYLLCLMWIVRNLFRAIIIQNYRAVRAEMYRPAIEPQDYEMIEFFIKRFKLWIGLTKTKEFRHKVKFEGMESLPTGTSQTSRFSRLASASTESHFSNSTISSGSVQSEDLTLPQIPTTESYDVKAYLDRLLPTVDSLLSQFDRVNKVTDDLYRIEADLEKVQCRINQKRRRLGRKEKSNAEKRIIPASNLQLLLPRAYSAVSESAVSKGPACEHLAEVVQSAHRALAVGSRSSDAPGRRAWKTGPQLSAGISQRPVLSSEPAAKPRPKSEEGQDRVMSRQQAPVKRRAWQTESTEGNHQ
ncbi:polycystin-1 [Heterodontus francisci]|uniref:polycystin-1 n=1 Tax=Heterodontus francisci TaxID=7792 RepID=UPI00355BE403